MKLWEKQGAQEFGKTCQILLGLSLLKVGFRIQIFQLSGRPDIVATRNNQKYAFEVKTQSGNASIKPDDLKGVKEYPEHAIMAVQTFPDMDCMWIIAKADNMRAGKWPVAFIKQYSMVNLETEINGIFIEILDTYFSEANLGSTTLHNKFNELWKNEK